MRRMEIFVFVVDETWSIELNFSCYVRKSSVFD